MEQAIPALYSGGNIFCQPDESHWLGIYFGRTLSLPWYYFVHTGLVISRIIPWVRAGGLGALNKP